MASPFLQMFSFWLLVRWRCAKRKTTSEGEATKGKDRPALSANGRRRRMRPLTTSQKNLGSCALALVICLSFGVANRKNLISYFLSTFISFLLGRRRRYKRRKKGKAVRLPVMPQRNSIRRKTTISYLLFCFLLTSPRNICTKQCKGKVV